MGQLRKLLFPFSAVYYLVTLTRNFLYNHNLLSSKSYPFPVITIGNLNTGGSGKTPMTEYVVKRLKDSFETAILSRGYGRATKGFKYVTEHHLARDVGDEPLQYAHKFPDVTVAVCEDRQTGIARLRTPASRPEVIVLDDAFQHRKVNAGFSVLLTVYGDLFLDDYVLPAGNLREARRGARRADCIVITKCPLQLPRAEREPLRKRMSLATGKPVFLAGIAYEEHLKSQGGQLDFKDLPQGFTLVTGIADPAPLVYYLKNRKLDFEHLNYPDHHNFTKKDFEALSRKGHIVTTEKDFMRLGNELHGIVPVHYMPMETIFLEGEHNKFDAQLNAFLKKDGVRQ